jgi:putative hydroxymethylpyrimidine transport system permease protein
MTHATQFLSRWWVIIAIVVIWQISVYAFAVNEFLLPSPFSIVAGIADDPDQYLLPLVLTLRTALIGFVLGVGVGYLMASLAWLWPIFNATLTPFALIIRTVPFVALIPVLTNMLGYSDTTAWVICAMVCFFPTFVLVGTGLSDIPANGNDLFSVAGASRWTRYRLLAVPASMVSLATSTRISAAAAFAAALISEFLMGSDGLAHVLSAALDALNMTQLWGAALCAIVVGVSAYLGANQFETFAVARWR